MEISEVNARKKLRVKSMKVSVPKHEKDKKEQAERSFRRLYETSVASGGTSFYR